MKLKHFFLIFSFLLSHDWILAQTCHDYSCVITKIERLLKQKEKDYKVILDNIDSAENYPNSELETIRVLRHQVFKAIEGERKIAIEARNEATNQRDIANRAKNQAQKDRITAIKAKNEATNQRDIAITEKRRAQEAERKTTAVLDKTYFYEGRFGLAYDKAKYGFIDKNLITKIKFKYDEALPFDNTGFAKVKKNNVFYLIDTLGQEYQLATDIDEINKHTLVTSKE